MLIHDFLKNSLNSSPDSVFVGHQASWFTYATIDQQSNRIAGFLRESGIIPGDRVSILLENSALYVMTYYAILKTGAVVVALNPMATLETLIKQINHSRARSLISTMKYFGPLSANIDQCPSIRSLIIENIDKNTILPKDIPVVDTESIRFSFEELKYEPKRIDIDLAAIVYTSGSSGDPKGVMLSHLNIVSNSNSIAKYLSLNSTDRVLAVLPFHYVYGSTLLNTHAMVGGSIVLENRFVFPNLALSALEDYNCTGFAGVPSTYMILLNKSAIKSKRFPNLRYVTQAGGAMPAAIQKKVANIFAPASLFVMYGSTELSPRLTYVPPEMLTKKWGSIGIPIPNTDAFIADENGNRLDNGIEGEIVGRGSNVMMGYWENVEATKRVLKNGLYFTGDRGVCDEDGYLFVVGRSNEIIKIGGNRVSQKEIEEELVLIEEIEESAVISIPDNILGEVPKAYIVARTGTNISIQKIREILSSRLPDWKIPACFVLCSSLPKNESGKILKRNLK